MIDAVLRFDAVGSIDYWNPAAHRLLALTGSEARGKRFAEVGTLLSELSRQPLEDPIAACLERVEEIEAQEEAVLVTAAGPEFPVRFSVSPIRDGQEHLAGAVLVLRDVTQLRQRERQITYLASHDPLTGLINRRQFEQVLEEVLREVPQKGRRHLIFYLDLDEFKRINDTCGHLAGDEMLKQVTSLLLSKVRSSDVLARLGGDEFGVVLRDCPFDKALEIADAMREVVKDFRFTWEGRIFQIGVSIGVVPVDAEVGREQLLRAADAACYVAKEKGRNRIQIFQPDDVDAASRFGDMQWIHRLQSALQEGRFHLYWQPLEALGVRESWASPGRLRGEVLVRMEDEGEIVPPSAFVPAAERYRLMAALDRWVLKTLLRRLATARMVRDWAEGDCLGVNLSGQSLAETGFEEFVLKVIRESGIPPDRLCFEVSETAVIANLAAAQRFFVALKKVGCRLSLDDFGSGLASFGYLRSLPVDFLKINGEFVRAADQDPVARTIVESVHRIGHVLGIETVGKCVETPKVRQLLAAIGVDYAQGYQVAGVVPFEPLLPGSR